MEHLGTLAQSICGAKEVRKLVLVGDRGRPIEAFWNVGIGAWGETRTLTWLPKPDFESGASTDFATQASGGANLSNLAEPMPTCKMDARLPFV